MAETKKEKEQKTKSGLIIAVIVLAALLLLIALYFIMNQKNQKLQSDLEHLQDQLNGIEDIDIIEVDDDVQVTAATLLEAVQSAKELVSYKYYYEAVGDYTKDKKFFNTKVSVPFTKDHSLFTYRGTMSAGIDLDGVSFDVDDEHKLVTATLPQPIILSHSFEIDSFKIYDLKNSIFTSTKLSDYAGLERELKELQESKLSENEEFWGHVKDNTELVLTDLLTLSGNLGDYLLQFQWE